MSNTNDELNREEEKYYKVRKMIIVFLIIIAVILMYFSTFFINYITSRDDIKGGLAGTTDSSHGGAEGNNKDDGEKDGNNQDGENQGENNQDGSDQDGSNQDGSNQGEGNQWGNDQWGSNQGGNGQGGSNQWGDNQGGNNQWGSNQGGNNQWGNSQGGNNQGGNTSGDNPNVVVDNSSRFKILQRVYKDGKVVSSKPWSELKQLDVFNNEYFSNSPVIAPGVSGSYNFTVENPSESKFSYDIKFTEQNTNNVNLKYRLKLNGNYIVGNANNYVDLNNLNRTNICLNTYSNDIYTLEWKWIDSDNDNIAGTTPGANYKLNISVTASQIVE